MRYTFFQDVVVSSIACSFFSLSTARTIEKRAAVSTLDPPGIAGWLYKGCYSDSDASRTLKTGAHFGDDVDVNSCINICSGQSYVFAGVEYSGQCFCGSYMSDAATKKSESDCNMACTKNATQACGGGGRINIYYLDGATPAPQPSKPVTNPGVDSYSYAGCYSDDVGSRALANRIDPPSGGDALTVAKCVDTCKTAGYSMAGVEYSGECYCDNKIKSEAFSDDSKCNMVCHGNSSEFCGGPGALNVYTNGTVALPSASSSASSAPSASASLLAGWSPQGCYTDDVGKRALSYAIQISSTTVEKCVNECSAAGYAIAGVEYGGECFCDNVLRNSQGPAPDGSVGCNMACAGNSAEICGGPNRLNVYSNKSLVASSSLSSTVASSTSMADSSVSSVTSSSILSAVTSSTSSSLASEASGSSSSTPVSSSPPSTSASGSSSSILEPSSAPSAVPPSSSALDSLSSSMSLSVSSSSTIASASASAVPILPSGWSYGGCWNEGTSGRALPNGQPDSPTNTIESCIAACSSLGYALAGLEYSSQCYCSSEYIENGGTLASSDSACAMICSGSAAEICGGPGLLSVYGSMTPVPAPVPVIKKTGLPQTWLWKGCYTDEDGNRDVGEPPIGVKNEYFTENSAEYCLDQCFQQGHDAGGTEYGKQCFCGAASSFAGAKATLLGDEKCNMLCTGNASQACGGPGTLAYYVLQ
ncbi:WSC-domain-containing protein [Aulographum hederae CBS 113979]|uniref:WSC-domain-containing protein n=1 Tax=Aulographum hederae CBS 113979 TaxID=1176131 RepID=A0A6G1H1B4_9PEZI|nr:WSC-domain-containing protein [Aulographum hederae CBS 113979]